MAILEFTNKTGQREMDYWGHAIQKLLDGHLQGFRSIRVFSSDSSRNAMIKLNLPGGAALEKLQAREIGQLLGVHRVVWGSFTKLQTEWSVTAYMMNVSSGNLVTEVVGVSTNWFTIGNTLSKEILRALHVNPSEQDLSKAVRWTSSSRAWELLCKAYYLNGLNKHPEDEQCIRGALEADPNLVEGYEILAALAGNRGEIDQAEAYIHKALDLNPRLASGYCILGTLLQYRHKPSDALIHLLYARTLDPDDPETLRQIGEVYISMSNPDRAFSYLEQAAVLDPASAVVHAQRGYIYAMKGDRAKALEALQDAGRLARNNYLAEMWISQAYDEAHEIPLALEHYDRFLALAKAKGKALDPQVLKQIEERKARLERRLTPSFLVVTEPKTYPPEELQSIFRARLTEEERSLVKNPLSRSPAMEQWAAELIKGATNEYQKLKLLFDSLTRHLDDGFGGSRTALETFRDWNSEAQPFRCQEYARLYVALARALHIKAYFTLVQKDNSGRNVFHACSAVFIGGKALLVDPMYGWFGVPHQEFQVLDDLQATVNHLNQFQHDLRRLEAAVKLDPQSGYSRFAVALARIQLGDTNRARLALNDAIKVAPNDRLSDYVQGVFALQSGDFTQAGAFFTASIKSNPELGVSHLGLATVLLKVGNPAAARTEVEAALRYANESADILQAKDLMSIINETLGTE